MTVQARRSRDICANGVSSLLSRCDRAAMQRCSVTTRSGVAEVTVSVASLVSVAFMLSTLARRLGEVKRDVCVVVLCGCVAATPQRRLLCDFFRRPLDSRDPIAYLVHSVVAKLSHMLAHFAHLTYTLYCTSKCANTLRA